LRASRYEPLPEAAFALGMEAAPFNRHPTQRRETMTDTQRSQTTGQGTVEQNVSKEVGSLKTEIQSLTEDIRKRINQAGDEAKQTWSKLDNERERFMDQVSQAAEETSADLRQMGSDLKRRLQGLRQQLQPKGEKSQSAQGQSSGSASK